MDKRNTVRPGRRAAGGYLSRYRGAKRKPVEIVIIAFGIVARVDEGEQADTKRIIKRSRRKSGLERKRSDKPDGCGERTRDNDQMETGRVGGVEVMDTGFFAALRS